MSLIRALGGVASSAEAPPGGGVPGVLQHHSWDDINDSGMVTAYDITFQQGSTVVMWCGKGSGGDFDYPLQWNTTPLLTWEDPLGDVWNRTAIIYVENIAAGTYTFNFDHYGVFSNINPREVWELEPSVYHSDYYESDASGAGRTHFFAPPGVTDPEPVWAIAGMHGGSTRDFTFVPVNPEWTGAFWQSRGRWTTGAFASGMTAERIEHSDASDIELVAGMVTFKAL